jgi:hypothetical protein
MRTIRVDGNGWLGCHRIGIKTDRPFLYNGYHASEDMPPNNPCSMAADYQELLSCWENGSENTEGCVWWYLPGGGCEGREAGDDFPSTQCLAHPRLIKQPPGVAAPGMPARDRRASAASQRFHPRAPQKKAAPKDDFLDGSHSQTRTADPLINSQML